MPRAAWWLGLTGMLPNVAALAVMLAWPEAQGFAAHAALVFSAMVASFVGGTWWGLAALRASPGELSRFLQLAIMPALTAWLAVLVQPATGFAILAMLFAVLPPTDRRLQAAGVTPGWWLAQRRPLSYAMAVLQVVTSLVLFLNPAD
ncbi:DUF3429 domain-containing protein [Roseomonas sp. CAU 1739]|uniref:DUF3429 domain-containing protein n=1 Tax=Roseomonas sp. CAU 1739 TaxID=3140364 RepID=UPI00325A4D29